MSWRQPLVLRKGEHVARGGSQHNTRYARCWCGNWYYSDAWDQAMLTVFNQSGCASIGREHK